MLLTHRGLVAWVGRQMMDACYTAMALQSREGWGSGEIKLKCKLFHTTTSAKAQGMINFVHFGNRADPIMQKYL